MAPKAKAKPPMGEGQTVPVKSAWVAAHPWLQDRGFDEAEHRFKAWCSICEAIIDSKLDNVKKHGSSKKFWRSMQLGEMASRSISEYLKMAQIILVLVPSSVEDERTFSTWGFIQNDLRSRMKEGHLNDCMRLYKQPWWDLETFPCSIRSPSLPGRCGTEVPAGV